MSQLFMVVVFFALSLFAGIECKHPNVLFIVLDDLRTSLGCYGDKNSYTPNVDQLASKSFIFQNTFAQQALCAPSRTSFLTSRRPDSLHLYDLYSHYWRTAVGNYVTIPQHFKDNGYYTKSIGKIFHPGITSNYTDDYPYSWSTQPFHPSTEQYKESRVCLNGDGSLSRNLVCPVIVGAQPGRTLPDLESTDEAVRFISNWKTESGGRPYFLAVGFHKPHIPLKFPMEYLRFHPLENVTLPENRWRTSDLPLVAWNPWNDIRKRDDIHRLNASFPFGPLPDGTIKKIIQSYKAAVTYIDDLIGKILRLIDNKTIIIFTSDHGWSLGEHGEFCKYSNYEVATKVPLIIHVPGLNSNDKPIIIDDITELVDLFPTLVDLTQVSTALKTCKVNSRQKLCTEGKSLVPLMYTKTAIKNKKITTKKRSVGFTQYPRPSIYPRKKPDSDKPKLNEINIMGYSMSTKRYRYTQWVQFNHETFKPNWNKTYGIEFYDHLIDKDENMNLAYREDLKNVTNYLRKELMLGWRFT